MTFPEIPLTTEEFLKLLTDRYLTTALAPQIDHLNAEPLLKDPKTWRQPNNVALRINGLLGKTGRAYLVSDPGLLVEVIGDMPGFVISYRGKNKDGYEYGGNLIIRPTGLERQPTLAEAHAAEAFELSQQLEQTDIDTYHSERESVEKLIIRLPDYLSVTLTAFQQKMLASLKYDLWELQTVERGEIEKFTVFAGLRLRLMGLLKDIGMQPEDLIDAVMRGVQPPKI